MKKNFLMVLRVTAILSAMTAIGCSQSSIVDGPGMGPKGNGGKYLAKPANLRVTNVTGSAVTLEWDSVANATNYEVLENIGGLQHKAAGYTNLTNCVLSGLNGSEEYKYCIIAYDETDKYYTSEQSEYITATTLVLSPPGKPDFTGSFSVSAGNFITINWNKVDTASDYHVEYSLEETTGFTELPNDTTLRLATSYTVRYLKYDTTYYFRMRASNMNAGTKQYGGYSDVKPVATAKLVKNLNIVSTTSSITMSWDREVTEEVFYIIYRSTSENGTYDYKGAVQVWGTMPASYTDTGLIAGATYYYKITGGSDFDGITVSASTLN